jgi:uncharacterized protein
MAKFIGRQQQLKALTALYDKESPSLVVISGRRRIGKSRLIEEFGQNGRTNKNARFYEFIGLPPSPTAPSSAQLQREAFAKQLQKYFGIPIKADDWWDLLWFLAEQAKEGRVIILLDEISWLGGADPEFLGKLKTVWDSHFSKNPNLILILCGSVSSWIEENILSNTGFLGRISLQMILQELSLRECNAMWDGRQQAIAAFEKFKILAVTGGVPKYLEEINLSLSAEENIRRLCFIRSGILFNEFEQIFSDLFSKKGALYKKIVTYLADGAADRNEIAAALQVQIGGVVSDYLDDLQKAGFITRDFVWRLTDGKLSKLSQYRLSDNYLRFYLKYIQPNQHKIEQGLFDDSSMLALPGWNSVMALQFENLVLNNRAILRSSLGIKAEEVVSDGPYLQRKTMRQSGCQIDYMVQTVFNILYVCEIKFSRHALSTEVISEMERKLAALKYPKGFSYRPILIHVNGVSEEVLEQNYFAQIIDFSELYQITK